MDKLNQLEYRVRQLKRAVLHNQTVLDSLQKEIDCHKLNAGNRKTKKRLYPPAN